MPSLTFSFHYIYEIKNMFFFYFLILFFQIFYENHYIYEIDFFSYIILQNILQTMIYIFKNYYIYEIIIFLIFLRWT